MILQQNKPANETIYVANTNASTDEQRMKDSRAAVDAFFRLLPDYSGLNPKDIAFIVDSSRGWIYNNTPKGAEKNYFDEMRDYLIRQARSKGYTAVDMDTPFSAHFREHGQRFEYPTDGHWNGMAHGIAADALADTPFFTRFMAR